MLMAFEEESEPRSKFDLLKIHDARAERHGNARLTATWFLNGNLDNMPFDYLTVSVCLSL